MDENPYKSPEFVGEGPRRPDDEWPRWVRWALGKKKTWMSLWWLLVGYPVVWASLFWVWASRRPDSGFHLLVLCFYSAVGVHGLLAVAWVTWHDAWLKDKPKISK